MTTSSISYLVFSPPFVSGPWSTTFTIIRRASESGIDRGADPRGLEADRLLGGSLDGRFPIGWTDEKGFSGLRASAAEALQPNLQMLQERPKARLHSLLHTSLVQNHIAFGAARDLKCRSTR